MRTAEQLARDNDLFRTTMLPSPRHKVVMTQGVATHPAMWDMITAVRNFNAFTPDNDPHGEHDMGAVVVAGERVFWKIDYYDAEYKYGADPRLEQYFCRVLTVMLASEY